MLYVFEREDPPAPKGYGVASPSGGYGEAGASAEDMRIFRAHGTRNTELAAALATLGFEPGSPPAPGGYGVPTSAGAYAVTGASPQVASELRSR